MSISRNPGPKLGIRDTWTWVPDWCRVGAELAPLHIFGADLAPSWRRFVFWRRIGAGWRFSTYFRKFRPYVGRPRPSRLWRRIGVALASHWCRIGVELFLLHNLVPDWGQIGALRIADWVRRE